MNVGELLAQPIVRLKADRKYWWVASLIVVAYVVAARLGFSLAFTTEQVTTVWPPSGLSLVAMLVLGYRYWPGVFVGALLANLLIQEPAWVAAPIAAGNTLEALTGAWLLKRVAGFKNAFNVPRDVLVYGLASAMSAVIAAFWGPVWLALGGLIDWSNYFSVALTWWQGDFMGCLVFGPLLLAFLNKRALAILHGHYLEGGILLAVTFAASIAVFTAAGAGTFVYLLFPFVMWAAIRFTQLGVVTCTLVITAVAVWATTSGVGPFGGDEDIERALVQLQVFIVVLSASALLLAMAITERMAVEERLRRQREELRRLDDELKEANKRVTNILADVLDGNHGRGRGNGD